MKVAQKMEAEAMLVREGLIDRRDVSSQKASLLPIYKHVEYYRLSLLDKGDTPKHAFHVAGALTRLCHDAGFQMLPEIAQDATCGALRRMKDKTSSRTANHALGALKAFLRYCEQTDRIRTFPSWLKGVKPFNERIDRKRVRRALTTEELTRLIAITRDSEPWHGISGMERATIYRLATATGLRANELRTLDREAFVLSGDDPHVIVRAGYSKHRREDKQPIRRIDASWLKSWLATHPLKHVIPVPERPSDMLRHDLEAAGIESKTSDGVVDFHSLRVTYITHLVQAGIDLKRVQTLARHSTITLTMDRYSKVIASDVRDALEGKKTDE